MTNRQEQTGKEAIGQEEQLQLPHGLDEQTDSLPEELDVLRVGSKTEKGAPPDSPKMGGPEHSTSNQLNFKGFHLPEPAKHIPDAPRQPGRDLPEPRVKPESTHRPEPSGHYTSEFLDKTGVSRTEFIDAFKDSVEKAYGRKLSNLSDKDLDSAVAELSNFMAVNKLSLDDIESPRDIKTILGWMFETAQSNPELKNWKPAGLREQVPDAHAGNHGYERNVTGDYGPWKMKDSTTPSSSTPPEATPGGSGRDPQATTPTTAPDPTPKQEPLRPLRADRDSFLRGLGSSAPELQGLYHKILEKHFKDMPGATISSSLGDDQLDLLVAQVTGFASKQGLPAIKDVKSLENALDKMVEAQKQRQAMVTGVHRNSPSTNGHYQNGTSITGDPNTWYRKQ